MNKGIYYASFAALLWGFLAIAVKVALNEVSPITVSWLRFAIAFTILVVYYLSKKPSGFKILTKPPKLAIVAGIALGLNYLGFIFGIQYTTPSIAQVFIQTGPVLLAISGFIFFKERISLRQGIGLIIVVLGMVIFYYEQILNVAGGLNQYKLGVLFVLFGALSWSVYAIFQKMAVKKHNPMELNLVIFGIPMLYYLPMVEFQQLRVLSFNNWLLMIFLGLNTLGAYGSLAYALKHLEANKISVILTLNPLITFATMALLAHYGVTWIAHENYTLLTILGATVVICGVILTVMKRKQ